MSEDGAMGDARRADRMWALALFLIAATLRLAHLGSWSFWADEIFTLRDVAQFPDALTLNPIPIGVIAIVVRALGESEWSARIAPALIGAASVPLIQWSGGRLLSAWTGRIAALFVALSPWHLFWSQNARHYAFVFALATLAVTALFIASEEGRSRWLIAALGASVGLVLCHAPAGVVLLGLAGYVAVRWLRRRSDPLPERWRTIQVAYFAPFVIVALGILLVPTARSSLLSGWGHGSSARSPLYVLLTFAHGVTLPILAVAAFSVFPRGPAGHPERRRMQLLLWCVLGLPLAFVVALSTTLNIAGYYLFVVSPFVFLLAGNVCARILEAPTEQLGRGRLLRWVPVCAVAASLAAGTGLYFVAENGGRPDWRGAFADLRSELHYGDRVYLSLPAVGAHYLDDPNVRWEKLGRRVFENPTRLTPSDVGPPHSYVVIDYKTLAGVDSDGTFLRWLQANGRRVARRQVYARASDRTIEVYRIDPPDQAFSRNTESP